MKLSIDLLVLVLDVVTLLVPKWIVDGFLVVQEGTNSSFFFVCSKINDNYSKVRINDTFTEIEELRDVFHFE